MNPKKIEQVKNFSQSLLHRYGYTRAVITGCNVSMFQVAI